MDVIELLRTILRCSPKTPNSALRSIGKILIYLGMYGRTYVFALWADNHVCPYIAFASVASLNFGIFGGCLKNRPYPIAACKIAGMGRRVI